MQKQVFRTLNITDTSTTDLEGVGSIRWHDNKAYRWVQNKHSAALAVGDLVMYRYASLSTMHQEVTRPDTGLTFLAGVAVSAIAADSYGWVQIYGYNAAALFLGATTAPALAVGEYIKGVSGQLYGTRDTATQPAYEANLQALEAVATTTTPAAATIKVLVNCI